jgi:hypothetical protein
MPLSKFKYFSLEFILMSISILIISDCNQQAIKNQTVVPVIPVGGSKNPRIEFRYTPVYESFEDLRGQVLNTDPLKNRVMVFIKVDTLWRVKPDAEHQLTPIRRDGSWTCDITTETNDHRATCINAFLLPDSVSLPPFNENDSLPPDIYSRALASLEIMRSDTGMYRIVTFSDYLWQVKECSTMCGPGPNYFSASPENIWRDPQGFLHLKITRDDTLWNCAEVILQQNLGYGTYTFQIAKIDRLDESCVLNLFTWDNAPEENHREIDIQLSKCIQQDNYNTEYAIQPSDQNGNRHRFNLDLDLTISHSFTWSKDQVSFASCDQDDVTLRSWTYQGLDIPEAGKENARINLWLCNPDSAQTEIEMIIQKFVFTPLDIN